MMGQDHKRPAGVARPRRYGSGSDTRQLTLPRVYLNAGSEENELSLWVVAYAGLAILAVLGAFIFFASVL
jgi:hypothetical protein